jgi:2-keto-4-pentenoate hydratase/2-oxohepta-3-ene-1,7-dioic acid hydratase in catechol pathway
MRILTYRPPGADRAGVGLIDRSGEGVIDLTAATGVTDLGALAERIDDLERFADDEPDLPLGDVTFERLLPWPRKIFCIGVNYGGRSAEYADRSDASYPSVFLRYPDSFTGHEQPLVRPPESPQLDYEGEIVAVIGTAGRRIPVADARSHIAGLTLGNEGTIRDWVGHAKFNVTQGKNWASSGAIGPYLVTLDEIPPFDEMEISTFVNGERRQHDSPASMKYSIEYQVHYLSTFTELLPGDVIFTGTPTGAGARLDPPQWLVPGDVVEVTATGLGTLRNTVVDEFDADELAADPRRPPEQQ